MFRNNTQQNSHSNLARAGGDGEHDKWIIGGNRRTQCEFPAASPPAILPRADHPRHPGKIRRQIIPAGKNPAREALELLAIEAYRTRHLNESQVRRILGSGTRMQVHDLLASHDVPLNYTMEHLKQDIAASDELHRLHQLQANHTT